MRLFVQHARTDNGLPRRSELNDAQAVVGVGSDGRPVFLILNSDAGATFLMTRDDDKFDEVVGRYLSREQLAEVQG